MYISNGYYMVWKTYLAEEHSKSCIVEMELKAGYGFSHTHTEILSIFFLSIYFYCKGKFTKGGRDTESAIFQLLVHSK